MQCMKCGCEIEAGQVFCAKCLTEMEKYPVKPGTVVQLPHRPAQTAAKKQNSGKRKPSMPLEEQVKLLRKWARSLALALVLALASMIALGYLWVKDLISEEAKFLPGQNYSSITSTEPGETE